MASGKLVPKTQRDNRLLRFQQNVADTANTGIEDLRQSREDEIHGFGTTSDPSSLRLCGSARTPEAWEKDKAKYAEKGINLQMQLKQAVFLVMLPTPVLGLRRKLRGWRVKTFNKTCEKPDWANFQLNDQFVCEMMGFQ